MAYKLSLILLLLAMIGATSSCTKEETTIVEYEPITIAGKWHVTSWYNATEEVIKNYPATLDSTIITFSDTGRFVITGACAGGSGFYLQTQTQEIMIYDFFYPGIACGSLADETQTILFDALEVAYSFELENNELTIRAFVFGAPIMYLRKLE